MARLGVVVGVCVRASRRVRALNGHDGRHGRVAFQAPQSSNWIKSSMAVISEVWAVY